MTTPNDDSQEYEIISEYELLKRQNRRRLIGAGAITLLAGCLFAAVASNEPKEQPQPIVRTTQTPMPKETEILRPNGLGKSKGADKVEAASAAKTNNGKLTRTDITPNATESSSTKNTIAQKQPENTSDLRDDEIPETAQQLTTISSPAPLGKPKNKPRIEPKDATTTDFTAKSGDSNTHETHAQARKRRQEERRLAREQAKQEAAAKRERIQQERIAKARESEQRRRQAQAIAERAEAERKAQHRATAERARQAQVAADKTRQAEREKLQAQQRAAEQQHKRNETRKPATASNTHSTGGKAVVQAGAFRDVARARQVQQKLRGMNYGATIDEIHTSKGTLYRVQTGAFSNRSAAEQAASKIRSNGLAGMIVEQK